MKRNRKINFRWKYVDCRWWGTTKNHSSILPTHSRVIPPPARWRFNHIMIPARQYAGTEAVSFANKQHQLLGRVSCLVIPDLCIKLVVGKHVKMFKSSWRRVELVLNRTRSSADSRIDPLPASVPRFPSEFFRDSTRPSGQNKPRPQVTCIPMHPFAWLILHPFVLSWCFLSTVSKHY